VVAGYTTWHERANLRTPVNGNYEPASHVDNSDYRQQSHFEMVGDKRISRSLSGLRLQFAGNQALSLD
jgi:hypothetical protein